MGVVVFTIIADENQPNVTVNFVISLILDIVGNIWIKSTDIT